MDTEAILRETAAYFEALAEQEKVEFAKKIPEGTTRKDADGTPQVLKSSRWHNIDFDISLDDLDNDIPGISIGDLDNDIYMDDNLRRKKEGTLDDYFDKEQQKVLKSLPDNQREALIELGKASGEEHEKLLQKIAEDDDLFPDFYFYEDVFARMGWA